jgi:hypothetical protein
VLLAIGLIGVLVVVAVGGILVSILNSQGVIQLPFGPPSARTIMQMPLKGPLRDAHIDITVKDKQSGHVEDESGTITFSPRIALTETPGRGADTFPVTVADGLEYQDQGDRGWLAQPDTGTSPLGFLSWSMTDPEPGTLVKVLGKESTPQGTAWHLKDSYTGDAEWWIRASDGFPLKVTNTRAYVNVVYTFSRFNSGATVHAPSSVTTDIEKNRVGRPALIRSARVSVDQVRDNVSGGPFSGAAGYRQIAMHVTYTNRTSNPTEVFPLDFPVTDSQGFVGVAGTAGESLPGPAFPDRQLGPGETAGGWVGIQVRDSARGLVVQVGDINGVARIPLNLG